MAADDTHHTRYHVTPRHPLPDTVHGASRDVSHLPPCVSPAVHRRSTTRWLRTRCVPDHLVGQSTDSLHPPLDMHRPTPHSRVGLPRRRLSEALSGTKLRKPAKPKGHRTWGGRNTCRAAALRQPYNPASFYIMHCGTFY